MSLSRPSRRSRRSAGAALAAVGAVALLLSGCTGGAPAPSPSPTADASEPIFASDEEALAAAVEAYELYRVISGEIFEEGGVEPERINPVVTETFASTLREEFTALEDLGLRSVGTTVVDTTSLVNLAVVDGRAEVSIYLCRDVSGTRIFDGTGSDVTPADRPLRVPSQAFFVSSDDDVRTLLVDGVEEWSGEDFC
ncbi:hypothetical protein ASE14_08665 [Agromyces sp. Root81]|uniref:hypothetical protein n=1 Tax=Agromyces sp. Root81 TaxID=1736601 RepID=UPI0006FC9BB1|nr:hypothetical protein [Agromyces sp. Root81]KRC61013.1 hypothetical protein ASE14_08665 [Agromyces sp. Root81]